MAICPPPAERPGDGCCVNWCAITKEDVRCFVRSLLPPGEAWRRDPAGRRVLEFADLIADQMHGVIESLCWMVRESDPCTAVDTVDDWAALYGIPPVACDLEGACNDPDVLGQVKAQLVCLFDRLQYGEIVNCCFYQQVGEIFGVGVCCVPEGRPNALDWTPGANSCADCDGKFPFYVGPAWTPPPDGCESPAGESCCSDGGGAAPDHYRGDSFIPTVLIFELTPPPDSDIIAYGGCAHAGDWVCFNPYIAAVKCVIESTLPEGVVACFRRV